MVNSLNKLRPKAIALAFAILSAIFYITCFVIILFGGDSAIRFFNLFFHVAHLHRACVRAQDILRRVFDIKSVLHVARRMVLWHIECVEVVVLAFNQVTLRKSEAHLKEDLIGLADEG